LAQQRFRNEHTIAYLGREISPDPYKKNKALIFNPNQMGDKFNEKSIRYV